MAGRPTLLTEEVRRKIEEVAALDGTIEEMAYYSGIHRTTLYLWLKEDKEFFDRIQSLRERPILKARQTIVKALDNPDHAFKYLEKKRKKEFGNAIDVTSDNEKLEGMTLHLVADDRQTPQSTTPDSK